MNKYIVQSGQSLMNIAVEVYGAVEGLYWLIGDNPAITGPTDRLFPGQVLLIRDDKVNPQQQEYLAPFGPFGTIEEIDRPTGIGFWTIEEYIVS